MAEECILDYLSAQNRPYNLPDIFMNLHNKIGKTALQKALNTLVENGNVIEKVYGKQKVYHVVQSSSLPNGEGKQDINSYEENNYEEKVKQSSEKLREIKRKLQKSETLVKAMKSMPAEVATEKRKVLQERILKLKTRLKTLSENPVKISREERDELTKKYELYTREWRKRKSSCLNVIDNISEGYQKSKKEFMEELGIETDEDAGVSLPPVWSNANSRKRKY